MLAKVWEFSPRFYEESWSSFFSEESQIDISQKETCWTVVDALCRTEFGATCIIGVGLLE